MKKVCGPVNKQGKSVRGDKDREYAKRLPAEEKVSDYVP